MYAILIIKAISSITIRTIDESNLKIKFDSDVLSPDQDQFQVGF